MMTPSIFGENLFDDDWMDRFEKAFWGNTNPLYGKHAKNMMKTDVREHENGYEVDIDLPGFKKDEIQVQLENGLLSGKLNDAPSGRLFRADFRTLQMCQSL